MKALGTILLTAVLLLGCNNSTKKQPLKEVNVPYVWENSWPSPPEGFVLGNATGLAINERQNIVVFHRGSRAWKEPMYTDKIMENTISEFDAQTGELLNSWGSNRFIMPHGLEIDQKGQIWVTDVGLHQVLKFSADGELLMTLGEAQVPGNDAFHFNLPTDVAVAADGSFYVSDGYGNSRIVKFSSDGTYLFEWGTLGKELGAFIIPHGIDLDSDGNVYVADRENNRIQKFDANGNYITHWQNKTTDQLYSVVVDKTNGKVFGIDYFIYKDTIQGSDIFRFDLDLNLEIQWGRSGNYKGPKTRFHDIVTAKDGTLYTGDILNNTVQKFNLKK